MTLTWWLWLLGGSALLVLEIITPGGFYVFFFGIGAIIVGLLAALGLAGPAWVQWLLFGAISVAALAIFRAAFAAQIQCRFAQCRYDGRRSGGRASGHSQGQPGSGRPSCEAVVWTARNEGEASIARRAALPCGTPSRDCTSALFRP